MFRKKGIAPSHSYNLLITLSVIYTLFEGVATASANQCLDLVSSMSQLGACRVEHLRSYYEGESIDADAPSGTVAGSFFIDLDWACLLPSSASSNYQQLGLIYQDSFHSPSQSSSGNINLETNVPGLLFRTASLTQLANFDYAKVISIITAPQSAGGTSNGSAVVADEIQIEGEKYFCGSQTVSHMKILELVRKEGMLEPGDYNISTKMPTPIVNAKYTTSSNGMATLGHLPEAQLTIGTPTCTINSSVIPVKVNDGAPMNLDDLDNIETRFNVPLTCSSIDMDIKYKLIPSITLLGHESLGGIGIMEGDDSASGVAYKIFKKNGNTFEAIDFNQQTHLEHKSGDVRNHNIDFAVKPFKTSEHVKSGKMDSSITLELDYQ